MVVYGSTPSSSALHSTAAARGSLLPRLAALVAAAALIGCAALHSSLHVQNKSPWAQTEQNLAASDKQAGVNAAMEVAAEAAFAEAASTVTPQLNSSTKSSGSRHCTIRGKWSGARWQQSSQSRCACEIASELVEDAGHAERWLFLGDSTMRHTVLAFANKERPNGRGPAPRCGLMDYLGMSKASDWVAPKPREGPTMYGLEHPFCTDTKSLMKPDGFSAGTFNVGLREIEYVDVEFPRDVTLQSPTTKTTQETVRVYLGKSSTRDVCVVNTGVHGPFKVDGQTSEETDSKHVQDVAEYIDMLQGHCRSLVWVTTSQVYNDMKAGCTAFDDKNPPGCPHNDRIQDRNSMVTKLLGARFPSVRVLDVWDMTESKSMHNDHVHMKPEYYDHIAAFLGDRESCGGSEAQSLLTSFLGGGWVPVATQDRKWAMDSELGME